MRGGLWDGVVRTKFWKAHRTRVRNADRTKPMAVLGGGQAAEAGLWGDLAA